jgi:hypothetical protein
MHAIAPSDERVSDPNDLLSAKNVRAACGGWSDMTLWRNTHHPDPEIAFPTPDVVLNGRKYWRRRTISERRGRRQILVFLSILRRRRTRHSPVRRIKKLLNRLIRHGEPREVLLAAKISLRFEMRRVGAPCCSRWPPSALRRLSLPMVV